MWFIGLLLGVVVGCGEKKGPVGGGEDGPALILVPEIIDVTGEPAQRRFSIRNAGTDTLEWVLSEEAAWLVVEVDGQQTLGGTVSGRGEAEVVVSTSAGDLADGIYDAVLRVRSNGGDGQVSVRMWVGDVDGGPVVTEGPLGAEPVVGLPRGALMDMIWVAPGSFRMGSPAIESGHQEDEGPQHAVTISRGFYLGRHEVTQGQWQSVMGDTPWEGQAFVKADARHPAVYVSWEDVEVFLRRLNEFEGEALYRLPTEAEWEYAARAGSAQRWTFGDDERLLWDHAWYIENAWDEEMPWGQPVGRKLPNAWGFYDMHGNVWEWVQDWYGAEYYARSPGTDPPGPASGFERVARGGSFSNGALFLRSAVRSKSAPGFRLWAFGFRVVREG